MNTAYQVNMKANGSSVEASAPAPAQQRRETVEFPPNTPVPVALQYAQGKVISTANGERVMYTLADGRVMFLDPGPAQKIRDLGVKVRENFFVSKRWSGKRGDPVEWVAWLAPESERARAAAEGVRIRTAAAATGIPETDLERQIREPIHQVGRRKAEAGAETPGKVVPPEQTQALMPWALVLLERTKQLVDVFAAASAYASQQHGNGVKAEDVRSLMLSAFVNVSEKGGCHAA
jgi:hypothetical protein